MTGDITDQFCQWLFTEENRGATIIAHDFRGFDGLFILKYMLDNNLKVKVMKVPKFWIFNTRRCK